MGDTQVKLLSGLTMLKTAEESIEEIKKHFGENSVVDYYGATATEDRQKNIKKFQEDPECRFFVGTYRYRWFWNYINCS